VEGLTTYTYDQRNQLIGADHNDLSNPDERYVYDGNGNRISSHLHGENYQTGENNQLLSDGIYNYVYDDEGNLILRTEIITGNTRTFGWDYRNRLVSIVDENSSGVTQEVGYNYDVLGRRIAKTVDGDTTHFVYNGDDVLFEFSGSDTVPTMRYLHGPGVDQVLAQESASGNLDWLLGDHLGTIRDLVDSNGDLQNHLTYDSFGNAVNESNPEISSRYQFTGREYDKETAMYYYRARYYNALHGRFLSQDPIKFEAGDVNLYRYIHNDPLNATDPNGEYRVELHYRPVTGGRYHTDIVTYYNTTSGTVYNTYWTPRPGPDGTITFRQTSRFIPFNDNYDDSGFDRDRIEVVYDDGTDCYDVQLERAIVGEFVRLDNANIRYHPLLRNSNSAAATVLRNVQRSVPRQSFSVPDRTIVPTPAWDTQIEY
jgi:RHS repeat-associated protein